MIRVPPAGVVISSTLADVLGVALGDEVMIEVLEGFVPSVVWPSRVSWTMCSGFRCIWIWPHYTR